jgi:hypothetical protein
LLDVWACPGTHACHMLLLWPSLAWAPARHSCCCVDTALQRHDSRCYTIFDSGDLFGVKDHNVLTFYRVSSLLACEHRSRKERVLWLASLPGYLILKDDRSVCAKFNCRIQAMGCHAV